MITEEMVLYMITVMTVLLVLLILGISIMINFGDEIEDFYKKTKRKIKYKLRNKQVKKNKKIDTFYMEHRFWTDGVQSEQREINETVFEIEEELNDVRGMNKRWIEEMNKKIGEVKVIVKDYEKMKSSDKSVVEMDVKKALEKITKELKQELKIVKEERQEKIKEIYQRKIEKLEAK